MCSSSYILTEYPHIVWSVYIRLSILHAMLENIRQRQQHRCQDILVEYFCRKFLSLSKLCTAKIENYHHYELYRTSLKPIYSMQEVLLVTCTGNSYFSILLPGREIYFLGLHPPSSVNRCTMVYCTINH